VAVTKRASPRSRKATSATPPVAGHTPEVYKLRLFVAGETAKSVRAIANLRVLCEQHLEGRYQIEVIDILENPHLARGNQIVAVPTLEIKLPHEVRKIIGDLSNTDRVLVGLALQEV
jgi:circadian clock protein KaiB